MRDILPFAWLLSALTLFAATPALHANAGDVAAAVFRRLA